MPFRLLCDRVLCVRAFCVTPPTVTNFRLLPALCEDLPQGDCHQTRRTIELVSPRARPRSLSCRAAGTDDVLMTCVRFSTTAARALQGATTHRTRKSGPRTITGWRPSATPKTRSHGASASRTPSTSTSSRSASTCPSLHGGTMRTSSRSRDVSSLRPPIHVQRGRCAQTC